ncbi:GNAT family N-acetyltransferase [Amycolatopsis sp. cmx-11-12]|uniref:GNAT family N-acetyltransferase n=1 Tax=Amycolatopsis sp. cmx-11-12 TaxID=2785795 RepID=UPI0039181C41
MFAHAAQASRTRLLLKVFGTPPIDQVPVPDTVVTELGATTLAARDTFTGFAEQLTEAGFGFLRRRWNDGPILVAVEGQRVIGPLATMTDRQGAKVMLPQYFGVLPAHRGRGPGRGLWRHAAAWGEHHQTAYQLLQTASDRLFCSEGLATLGFATAVPA